MKNSDIVITNKKKRVLKGCIKNFLEHRLSYSFGITTGKLKIPEPNCFKEYLQKRNPFLKDIQCDYFIKTANNIWYSVIFQYNDFKIELETGLFEFSEIPKETIEIKFKTFPKM